MKKTMNQLGCAAAAVLVFGIGSVAIGQEQAPPPEPTKAQEPKAPPAGEPTLDDLLGIKPTEGAKAPDAGKDAAKAELDRQLSAAEMDDEFEQAVKLMGDTARRLGEAKDAGLDTQRMQEQTLTIVPKMLAVVATLILLMPWILGTLREYTTSLFENLAAYGKAG